MSCDKITALKALHPAHYRGVLISGPVDYLYVYIYSWEFMGSMDKCPDY